MIHGIINVYKEKGFTSHDVVAKLRGILKQKKIGHTGTLDPEAEGVLPVCLGAGTKLCDMLTDKDKIYRAVLLLGQVTDTQDTTGEVLQTCPVLVTEEQIRTVVKSFIGDYQQIPPMYSALKVNGKKLYELAREGKTVERKARPVKILDIDIESVELPRVTMTVKCSKGTYIRTLCHDLGETLGCGGCMEALMRTQVGIFSIKDSLCLAQVEQMQKEGTLEEKIYAVDEMFPNYPARKTKIEFDRMLYNGNALYPEHLQMEPLKSEQWQLGHSKTDGLLATEKKDGMIRVYDSAGQFCGIYVYHEEKERYQPEKMFLTGNENKGRELL